MSTVDEAVTAGAQALDSNYNPERYRVLAAMMEDYAGTALKAMWPILSAPLRELHVRRGYPFCVTCNDSRYPCPTMQAVLATDRALGIGESEA